MLLVRREIQFCSSVLLSTVKLQQSAVLSFFATFIAAVIAFGLVSTIWQPRWAELHMLMETIDAVNTLAPGCFGSFCCHQLWRFSAAFVCSQVQVHVRYLDLPFVAVIAIALCPPKYLGTDYSKLRGSTVDAC